jgi:hypothetical protein
VEIHVSIQQIGERALLAVSCYNLHAALAEVLKRNTLEWVKSRLKDFREGVDYVVRPTGRTLGTPGAQLDYILTLECAAALARSTRTVTGLDVSERLLTLARGA